MKKDWEIYRDTGILGGYMPECAKLRQTEDGDVATVFRDTTTCMEEDCITKQREMLIGGRRFCITSVFPAESCATPTEKLLACIAGAAGAAEPGVSGAGHCHQAGLPRPGVLQAGAGDPVRA